MSLNPHVETLEPWVSAGLRRTVPMAELSSVFGATFEEVAGAVGAAGGQIVGPAFAQYFGMPGEVVDVEIGFGVDRVIDAPTLLVTAHPATQAAVGTHQGPYELLAQSYEEFMPWLGSQDLHLADSMFEFYDTMPTEDPSKTVTRMVFPLA